MVVRFEHMWTAIPVLLIPMVFVTFMMGFIKVWMLSAPKKHRPFPSYSLHVMQDLPPDKPSMAYGMARTKPQYPPPPSSSSASTLKARPVSSHVLPFVKPGHTQQMLSGANTPGGMSVYSLGGRSGVTPAPKQWQGKFL